MAHKSSLDENNASCSRNWMFNGNKSITTI
jgi:hypothetical protein